MRAAACAWFAAATFGSDVLGSTRASPGCAAARNLAIPTPPDLATALPSCSASIERQTSPATPLPKFTALPRGSMASMKVCSTNASNLRYAGAMAPRLEAAGSIRDGGRCASNAGVRESCDTALAAVVDDARSTAPGAPTAASKFPARLDRSCDSLSATAWLLAGSAAIMASRTMSEAGAIVMRPGGILPAGRFAVRSISAHPAMRSSREACVQRPDSELCRAARLGGLRVSNPLHGSGRDPVDQILELLLLVAAP